MQARLNADGLNVHLLEADITDSQGLQAAAQEAESILGSKGLDALINNAACVSEVTALRSMKELYVLLTHSRVVSYPPLS